MNASQRGVAAPYFLVVHFTGGNGSAAATAAYMARKGNSVHGIVDRSGDVEEPVPLDATAWHAGDHTKNYKGGSRFPALEQLSASPYTSICDVPYRRRFVNEHSVGVELCNAGHLLGKQGPYMAARHRNPASRSTQWQEYTDAQIGSLVSLVQRWRLHQPALLYVTGHEDVTNRHTLGRTGGKVDPGPAFPWSEFCAETGLRRVMFDFNAPGWRTLEVT